MSKHALLSASGSHRWLNCTKSARLEEQIPHQSSSYANEGTLAHELCEATTKHWLGEIDKHQYDEALANIRKSEYFTEEMLEHAESYADFIHNRVVELGKTCVCELEVRVDFSEWAPEGFGTCDCCIACDGLLEIIDFKYGKGVAVEAENNPQLKLYAGGAYRAYEKIYNIKQVKMTIFQPRNGGISTAELSVEELLKWLSDVVKPTARLAFAGQGEYAPSESTCKFCKAKNQCKARADANLALFDENPIEDLMTPQECADILAKASDIKTWLTALEELVFGALRDGQEVNGWKLVEGRSIRRYVDDVKVIETLEKSGYSRDLITETKPLTITALEKNLGKATVEHLIGALIEKPEGKPTLAPESDKRPPLNIREQIVKEFDT